MKRENRRVAAMSWGAGDDPPPPKPSKNPSQKDSSTLMSLADNSTNPYTYIIAENAEVLAQLMRENEARPFNPSAYNTPATVFNTLGVQIDASKSKPMTKELPTLPLKTVMLPASELQKLNPFIDGTSHTNKSLAINTANLDAHSMKITPDIQLQNSNINSQTPTTYPIPSEIIDMEKQQFHANDQSYKAPIGLQHSSIGTEFVQKSKSLDRNISSNKTKIFSLELLQNSNQLNTPRTNSLVRQLNFGNEISNPNYTCNYNGNTRSGSLERGTHIALRSNSFEYGSNKQMYLQNLASGKEPEHEVIDNNQSVPNSHNKMNTHNYLFGSLDRNHQGIYIYVYFFYLMKT